MGIKISYYLLTNISGPVKKKKELHFNHLVRKHSPKTFQNYLTLYNFSVNPQN